MSDNDGWNDSPPESTKQFDMESYVKNLNMKEKGHRGRNNGGEGFRGRGQNRDNQRGRGQNRDNQWGRGNNEEDQRRGNQWGRDDVRDHNKDRQWGRGNNGDQKRDNQWKREDDRRYQNRDNQWGRGNNQEDEKNTQWGKNDVIDQNRDSQWGRKDERGENRSYQTGRYRDRDNTWGNEHSSKIEHGTTFSTKQEETKDNAFDMPRTSDGQIDYNKLKEINDEQERIMYAHLPDVVKCTYKEHNEVAKFTPEEVLSIRKQKKDITVSTIDGTEPQNIPNIITEFEHAFHPYPLIMEAINIMGFKEPSPIQCQMWPLAMSGRDIIGIAQTGSGKTIAYLLPALLHIEKQPYFKDPLRKGPLCVILAPTRELAQQIHSEVNKYSYKNIRSVCVYGQGDFETQKRALQSGVEVVVATTGRLLDFVKREVVDLRGVSYLVLDEADRMLDMGFMSEMVRIMYKMRKDRQTLLTTATWQFDVEYIVKKFMLNPIKINVGELDLTAVDTVTQSVIVCEEDDKYKKLMELLSDIKETDKVIVFTNRKAVANYIPSFLIEKLIDYRMMHGDLDQSDREVSLSDLQNGICNLLIATDVAARGLDIVDLTLVINFDLPRNMEEYVHRSGRTGRAGKSGEVVSLVTWQNRNQVQQLIEILQRSNQEVPLELRRMGERAQRQKESRESGDSGGVRGGRGYGRGGGRGRGRGGREFHGFGKIDKSILQWM